MVTVGNRHIEWRPGMTLADLMDQLEEGRFYAVVRLNGRLVSRPYFNRTPVPDDAEVLPLPLVAGG
jgi:sulfur carrier protein ThiS